MLSIARSGGTQEDTWRGTRFRVPPFFRLSDVLPKRRPLISFSDDLFRYGKIHLENSVIHPRVMIVLIIKQKKYTTEIRQVKDKFYN